MNTDGVTVSEAIGRAIGVIVSAALLTQKQAELAMLTNVTLPKLHHAIGRRLMSVETLPADLERQRSEIRELESRINGVKDGEPGPAAKHSGDGIVAKAAQFAMNTAQKALDSTADVATTARIQSRYVSLGRTAADLYGEEVVPADIRSGHEKAATKRARLVEEMAALNAESAGRWVTPWRVVQVAGLASVLGVGWFVLAPGRTVDRNRSGFPQAQTVDAVAHKVASVSREADKPREVSSTPRALVGPDALEDSDDGGNVPSAIDQGEESWRLIPPSTKALLHIDVRNAVQSPQWRANQLAVAETTYGQQGLAMLAEVEAKYGFRYERDLDRILVAFPIPDGNPLSDVLVVAYGDFKPERVSLVMAAFQGAAILNWRGTTVIRIEQPNGKAAYLAFLSSTCAVLSLDEGAVHDAITRAADGSGGLTSPLAAAMRSQSPGTHVFLGISPAALLKVPGDVNELAENSDWGSVSLDSNRSGPGATLTVQAKTVASAQSWERWVDRTVLRDKAGNPNFQGFSGGIRPISEAIQVRRDGRTVRVVLKDFR